MLARAGNAARTQTLSFRTRSDRPRVCDRFALHSLVNFGICLAGLRDVLSVAITPLCALSGAPIAWTPSHLACSVHLHHLVAFTTLRFEDIFHHLVFVGGLALFNYSLNWGPITNFLIFFMTGLPGGIDYAILTGVKLGRVARLTEKRYNAQINTWLRIPGLMATAAVMWICSAHGRVFEVPPLGVVAVIALTLANGLYYGEQAIGNYHRVAASTGGDKKADKQNAEEKETKTTAEPTKAKPYPVDQ